MIFKIALQTVLVSRHIFPNKLQTYFFTIRFKKKSSLLPLGLSCDRFPSGFPTEILHAFPFCTCYWSHPFHPPKFQIPKDISHEGNSSSSTITQLPAHSFCFAPFRSNVLLNVSLCVFIAVLYTLVAGLLARSQYPEGSATGHLGINFSWFPCVYKRMLRWFPTLQVATACF